MSLRTLQIILSVSMIPVFMAEVIIFWFHYVAMQKEEKPDTLWQIHKDFWSTPMAEWILYAFLLYILLTLYHAGKTLWQKTH